MGGGGKKKERMKNEWGEGKMEVMGEDKGRGWWW